MKLEDYIVVAVILLGLYALEQNIKNHIDKKFREQNHSCSIGGLR